MGGNSSRTSMACPTVNASAKHTASVIFLHGLGDTGHGWLQMFNEIRNPHIKYICPNASAKPVTLNMGMVMPSWFDIKGLTAGSPEDEAGIIAAANLVQKYIEDEEKLGIPRNRIIVGGFSQGGAAALYSALTAKHDPLAGILALSTWMPLHKKFPGVVAANQATPILQCHGEADPVVNLSLGQATAQLLGAINPNHQLKTYAGLGHSSHPQEMRDVETFISTHLPPS